MTLICYGDNVEKIKTIIKIKHLNIRIIRTFEHIALADHYSKQGSVQEIYDDEKIDLDTVINKCEELMNGKKEN